MESFQYVSHSNRVVFGEGEIKQIKAELENLQVKRTLIISTPGRSEIADDIGKIIGKLCVSIFTGAVQHVPLEVVHEVEKIVEEHKIDNLVAVGGGSSIGLAKAVALKRLIPIIAVPTTYAGSEMTTIWGITENNLKTTGTDVVVKPKVVIYDPQLTVTLPKKLVVTSGMNAMAHCAEALYAESANPIISLLAEEGVRILYDSLPRIIENESNMEARSDAQYGTMLGGTVLGSVGMALHHKLCHTLGGTYNLPHAETHTVILPYAISYNAAYAPNAMKALARALNTTTDQVPENLFDLIHKLGGPKSLKELGMKEEDLDEAAELAVKNPYYNPRPITKESIRQLLQSAYEGKRYCG